MAMSAKVLNNVRRIRVETDAGKRKWIDAGNDAFLHKRPSGLSVQVIFSQFYAADEWSLLLIDSKGNVADSYRYVVPQDGEPERSSDWGQAIIDLHAAARRSVRGAEELWGEA